MEKISKEELLRMANLTEEDLEKISGGAIARDPLCLEDIEKRRKACVDDAYRKAGNEEGRLRMYLSGCAVSYTGDYESCYQRG